MNDKPNDTVTFDYIKLIAIARIVSLIFSTSEHEITPLTSDLIGMVLQGLNTSPSDVKHLVAMTQTMYKNEAMEVVTKFQQQEKERIMRVIAEKIPSFLLCKLGISGQQRFRHMCETCGLPWKIVDEMMLENGDKWVYEIRGYCFEDQESALEAVRIIDEPEALVRKVLGHLAPPQKSSPIVEKRVGKETHIWSIDEFKDSRKRIDEQELLRWYVSQTAYNVIPTLLDTMVERKRKEWGQ